MIYFVAYIESFNCSNRNQWKCYYSRLIVVQMQERSVVFLQRTAQEVLEFRIIDATFSWFFLSFTRLLHFGIFIEVVEILCSNSIEILLVSTKPEHRKIRTWSLIFRKCYDSLKIGTFIGRQPLELLHEVHQRVVLLDIGNVDRFVDDYGNRVVLSPHWKIEK